eukprot:Skav228236  [mRNA]  locus=scaffold3112:67638:68672:+ [translate_table: standard]
MANGSSWMPTTAFQGMQSSVDVIADSDSDVAEVVDVVESDGEDEVAEVNLAAGAPPLTFHGYRRGRELGQGGSSQVFVCSKPGSQVGFAAKAVNLRRLQMSPDVEREWKKLCREARLETEMVLDGDDHSICFLHISQLTGRDLEATACTSKHRPETWLVLVGPL